MGHPLLNIEILVISFIDLASLEKTGVSCCAGLMMKAIEQIGETGPYFADVNKLC